MSGIIPGPVSSPLTNTPKTIVNRFSKAAWTMASLAGSLIDIASAPKSGNTVANTLKAALSLTGPGVIEFLGVCTSGAPFNYTIRIQLVLDGVVVFDYTSAANVGSANYGAYLIGATDGSNSLVPGAIPFKSSCVVNVATSTSGTDLLAIPAYYTLR